MKVVFFGSSRNVLPILNALNNAHDLALVVTTEQGNQEPVKFFCQTHKINCILVRKAGDLMLNQEIQRINADIGVVADFGIIIPQSVLEYFPFGIINIHPSLLPKYRGPTPVQTALLNGDKTTGVSVMLVDKLMDHGPVFIQKEVTVEKEDTAKTLYERLFKLGAETLLEVLQKYEHRNITPVPQDDSKATITKFLTREDGFFNYKIVKNLALLPNVIRAYYPWPGAWTKAKLNHVQDEKIIKFLPEGKVQVEGGKEMLVKDLVNGYPGADKEFLNFLRKAFP